METSLTGNCLHPPGPSEQYFWLSNQNSAKHFVIAAKVAGDATVEEWVSAVAAAQLRHPLLRVLGRVRSGRAAVLPRARKHSDSVTNRSRRGVCSMAGRDGQRTRNTHSSQRRPTCTYHSPVKEWWINPSSCNASFHRGWAVVGFRYTRHP